jgi:hypothetical protein
MGRFVHNQNIRNFADKFLVEEEDRVGRGTEQLDLANSHIDPVAD